MQDELKKCHILMNKILTRYLENIEEINKTVSAMFSSPLLNNDKNVRESSMQAQASLNHLLIAASKNLQKFMDGNSVEEDKE